MKHSKTYDQQDHASSSLLAIAMATKPLALRIPQAIRVSGISRSGLYRLAASGDVVFLKCGRCTLVEFASLEAVIGKLPKVKVKAAA